MKKYLIILLVVALLIITPAAYSMTNNQPCTYQIMENVQISPDKIITKAEFAGMLVSMAQLNEDGFSWIEIPRLSSLYIDDGINKDITPKLDEPLTYTAAAKALINILQISEVNVISFIDKKELEDPVTIAYKLGLMTAGPESGELNEPVSGAEAVNMINNLLALLNLEMGKPNAAGVSYMLTPQPAGNYSLELFCGQKPSAV